MSTNRMEAFFDAVVAIIITIMVLEMRPPHDTTLAALKPLIPVFLTYVLSFIYLGIYWTNHHHMLHVTDHITGSILWANLFLLFWLSLVPFTTGWMGENHFESVPVASYGVVLFMAAVAYAIVRHRIVASQGSDSPLRRATGSDWKGNVSTLLYLVGIGLAFVIPWIAVTIYTAVALLWIVPDRRIERLLAESGE